MSRGASPFSPRAILAVLVVGAAAFLLFLYAIGAGWTGREDQNGGAHAAANGLNGFAGLVRLLEAQGHEVELSRSKTRLQDEGLLVLTPPIYADGERIAEVIRARRYDGPTLVILPKWPAMEASGIPGVDARRGWVLLGSPVAPGGSTSSKGSATRKSRSASDAAGRAWVSRGPFPSRTRCCRSTRRRTCRW